MLSIPKISIKTGLLISGVVVLVSASAYFGWQYYRSRELLKNPTAAAIAETNDLVRRVGRHAILPSGETPTVATVSDKSKLAGQAFFVRAEEGDKVLIYAKEGRAILFRPKTNKIVEMTAMVLPSPTPEPQLTEANLTIFNGTGVSGLATIAEKQLENIKNIKVVAKENAVSGYKESLVVVLNPRATNLASQVANLVKAKTVTNLPAGEERPVGDILLILGDNY